MARNGECFGHPRKGLFVLALAGLLLSTGGVLLHESLLTISQKCPDKTSIFLPVYTYLFILNPLCFYLNMLLLLLHVSDVLLQDIHSVFLMSLLSRAAHTVSFTTLLLSAHLSIHAAVVEEGVASAIGATLVCLAWVTILTNKNPTLPWSLGNWDQHNELVLDSFPHSSVGLPVKTTFQKLARNGECFGHHHKGRFPLALAGLLLSTGGVLLQEPLLTVSPKCPDKISTFLPVYAYLFILNPLCFYLNMLLLLLYVSEAPTPDFLMSRLLRAAHTVSFATLLLSAPLSLHAPVAEEHVDSAIGAASLCLALITILTSVFKKFLIYGFRTSRGVVPALFAICISTGYLISFDPILSFSEKDHYDPLTHHIPIHLLLSLVCFFVFMLGIALVILCISAPADGQHASIRAENLVIAALSVSFATLLVIGYIKVYGEVTDMAAIVDEAIKVG